MSRQKVMLREEDLRKLAEKIDNEHDEEEMISLANKLRENHTKLQKALGVAELPEDKYDELLRLIEEEREAPPKTQFSD